MKITVTGKQIDLGEAFQQHVRSNLDAAVRKYFDGAVDSLVVVAPEAHLYKAEITVHVGSGIEAHAAADGETVHAAFDGALERMEKQLRRDKRKRRNHHAGAPRKLDGTV
jgi:ribosomal subunit interface protein